MTRYKLLSALLWSSYSVQTIQAFGFYPPSLIKPHLQQQKQYHSQQQQKQQQQLQQHLQEKRCFAERSSNNRKSNGVTSLSMIMEYGYGNWPSSNPQKDIKIPLLLLNNDPANDEPKGEGDETKLSPIIPLPSSHLPAELSSLNLYGVEFQSASQKLLLEEAKRTSTNPNPFDKGTGGMYGVVVHKPDSDSLVGAIGCAVDILISASPIPPSPGSEQAIAEQEQPPSKPMAVLTRGSFRFKVKEIVSTIPFPVAIVDELVDDDEDVANPASTTTATATATAATKVRIYNDFEDAYEDEEDDDYDHEDDDGYYQNLPASELSARTLHAMKAYIQILLSEPPKTPLEQAILENAGYSQSVIDSTQATYEEMAAIFDVFTQELMEMHSFKRRRFSIAFLAAEILSLKNELRVDCLTTTDSVDRLRIVLKALESKISMERAKKMAQQLSKQSVDWSLDDSDSNPDPDPNPSSNEEEAGAGGTELKVGTPSLPPWVNQLKAGMRVEYFWNEDYGWCQGVIEEVVKIVDEVVVTVRFDDDEVHKLPVTAEDKIRWRPL